MPGRRLAADWVLPVGGPPIRGGAVLVGEGGRIVSVGPAASVPASSDAPADYFPGAALLPGLVNAHTHLELTGFEGLVPENDFPAWIRRVRALKAERSAGDFLAAARRGVAECFAAGVTTVGDTGDSGAVIQALHEVEGSGIAYLEVFGPHPSDAERQLADFRPRVELSRRFVTPRLRLGLSPHAPYSVSGPLYAAIAHWAEVESLPLAVHIAESPAESLLLGQAEGPFAEMWQARGIPLPSLPGRTPIEWLETHGVLGQRTLCIHVVQSRESDLARLVRHDCGVAHCPRSNLRHGHGMAPLREMLDAGVRVGVGTDSVASLSPLDLLAEARAARSLAALSAEEALELCSVGGARALGLESEIGTLTIGKWGDAVVLRLPAGVDEALLVDSVLTRGPGDVAATFIAGREVWRS